MRQPISHMNPYLLTIGVVLALNIITGLFLYHAHNTPTEVAVILQDTGITVQQATEPVQTTEISQSIPGIYTVYERLPWPLHDPNLFDFDTTYDTTTIQTAGNTPKLEVRSVFLTGAKQWAVLAFPGQVEGEVLSTGDTIPGVKDYSITDISPYNVTVSNNGHSITYYVNGVRDLPATEPLFVIEG